ncbi:MAG: hypothetical protein IJU18_01520 [Oscillospiraceae bacterium]|nr:hypothetical protein [Oscillospiraceae bacterium]
MKKALAFLAALVLALSLCACGAAGEKEPEETKDVDVDLTALSSTMVYSEVYNMIADPDAYVGKRIKMSGMLDVYEGVANTYFSCVVADATACCAQGLEFVLKENYVYPDDYPAVGEDVTVVGTFTLLHEGQYAYIQIADADLVQE